MRFDFQASARYDFGHAEAPGRRTAWRSYLLPPASLTKRADAS